jgi:hypothetical protein
MPHSSTINRKAIFWHFPGGTGQNDERNLSYDSQFPCRDLKLVPRGYKAPEFNKRHTPFGSSVLFNDAISASGAHSVVVKALCYKPDGCRFETQ